MRILLTISGGIDSMYLASRAGELFPGAVFAVAHCNFNLRGAESDGDCAFVKEWCAHHSFPFFSKEFDTSGYAEANGISIEMAARELRYEWFGELCRTEGFDAIAVAHNANDNAETLMLNLLRGTGTRGIRGMSASGVTGGMTVLRPLLGTTRKEIERWMTAHGQTWREDRTNAESEYKRNKLRNLAFPVFGDINPSFVKTLGEDMQRFRMVDDIAEDYFLENVATVFDGDAIDTRRLLQLKHWEYVLWRILEHCSFSYETFGKMTALLEKYKNEPSGTVTLGGKKFESPTHIVRAVRKKLLISER